MSKTGQLEHASHFPVFPVPYVCYSPERAAPASLHWPSAHPSSRATQVPLFPQGPVLVCCISSLTAMTLTFPSMALLSMYSSLEVCTDNYIQLSSMNQKFFKIKIAHKFEFLCILVIRLNELPHLLRELDHNINYLFYIFIYIFIYLQHL